MFLRPQHFQAADRYWHELLETSERWDHVYNYGVRSIEFSREALANYQFELSSCQARLRDGTLVAIEPGQDSGRVDLKAAVGPGGKAVAGLQEAFAKTAQVLVYLAVPKLSLGRANVGRPGSDSHPRYMAQKLSFEDETTRKSSCGT
jgi:type VI secretion system protein ImpJ